MSWISRREFLHKSAAAVCCTFLFDNCGKAESAPNIIFFLTDDQRWDTLGCMGNSTIQTPNLDRLARHGTLFKNHFITYAYCAPSRATFLTGRYYDHHQIARKREWPPGVFEQTYPVLLRQAGYYTGFIGKWHMGEVRDEAFDYCWGFAGQARYYNMIAGKTEHLTTTIGGKAIDFIKQAPQNQPFCLSVSFKAPHVDGNDPRQFLYDPAYESLYRDVTIAAPESAAPEHFQGLPDFIKNSEARKRWELRFSSPQKFQESVKGYYRLITGVDTVIGEILATLREKRIQQQTVVIFSGDNGFFLGEHGLAGKWLMYEESIRTPLIIMDPRAPGRSRGNIRDEMVLNIDLAPTVLALAGVQPPAVMQGRSLLPLVSGQMRNDWREAWFYQHYAYGGNPPENDSVYIPSSEGVRLAKWKYIRYIDQQPNYEQLFDLEKDPHEMINLAYDQRYEKIKDALREKWRELKLTVAHSEKL